VPKGGLARRATAIAQLREQIQGNVLLLDSGDSLFRGGSSTTNTDPDQGVLLIEAMNAMGYDAMALGGRDLDAPTSTVQARFEGAHFSLLSANVESGGALLNILPYLLRQADGHTIAIIGATSEAVEQRSQTLGIDLAVENAVEAVQRAVEEVQDRADIIVVLSNLEREKNELLAQTVSSIDVIIGVYRGWPLTPSTIARTGGQVILHASGTQGEYLGVLSLHFDAQGQVASFEGYTAALTAEDYADDPEMTQIMREYARKP